MTWLIVRLIFSLAFIAGVLWFAARVAKKRGIGGTGNGVIEVIARQRMGRTSTVNVVRIADMTLVVGATEEQITLLAEVDNETVELALHGRGDARVSAFPARVPAEDDEREDDEEAYAGEAPARGVHRSTSTRSSAGPLTGSVLDRNGWGSLVNQMRERTVRRP
jgi:flagellar protein FliO/FliZ